jgi:serine/threonine protein kinase
MDTIYEVSLKGDVKALEKTLRADMSLLSVWDKENGMAPIHWTANGGKLECIALLLELGADVGAVDRNDNITPLHIVVARGFAACAKLLIDHGADVNALSKRRESPLHVACWAGHVSCVKILLEHNSVVNMKDADYGDSPLHKAAEGGHVLCVKCLLEASADVNMRNRNGNTPLHYAAKAGSLDCFKLLVAAGADVCARGQENKRPFNYFKRTSKRNEAMLTVEFSLEALTNRSNELWFLLIQSTMEGMGPRILDYVTRYPHLAFALDASGRCALDVASPSNRLAIHSSVLWHGRYRIIDEYPEHISPTCIVYRAVDEAILDASGHPIRVAIKLMRFRDQFSHEIEMRNCGFDSEMIVDILCCNPSADCSILDYPEEVTVDFDAIGHPSSSACKTTKALAEQVYCTVMPLAEKNLFVSIKQENLAQDIDEVRRIIIEIAQCVNHCHSFGILHGDINPMNIVRLGKKWKLLDLDNASRIGEDAIGDKISSSFAPPEAFYVDAFTNTVHSRTLSAFRVNVDVDILIAHPSYDVWSLGCVMYQLLSVDSLPLFVTGKGDNLSTVAATDCDVEDNIWSLIQWTDELKMRKLNRIQDPLARNLISQMLHKDPRMRPTLSRVLAHPFLSLRNVPRLLGEKAQYDVYISHRYTGEADTLDYVLASELYNELLQNGLKVFWAPLSLSDYEACWRDEFSAALVNSSIFVPVVSRNSLNHPGDHQYNVNNLCQESSCDDLVLEYRLAVELRDAGYIDQIFPLMIGDCTSLKVAGDSGKTVKSKSNASSPAGSPFDELMSVTFSNYFFSGCFPRAPNTHIDSLESDLLSHFELLGLGLPLFHTRAVSSVLSEILSCSGTFVEGDYTFVCPDPSLVDASASSGEFPSSSAPSYLDLQSCPDLEFAAPVLVTPVTEQVVALVAQLNEAALSRAAGAIKFPAPK